MEQSSYTDIGYDSLLHREQEINPGDEFDPNFQSALDFQLGIESVPATVISSGTISGQQIDVSGANGMLQSSNFVLDTTGWQLTGEGILNAVGANISGNITISNPEDINTSELNNDAGWTDDAALNTFISGTYDTDITYLQNQIDGVVVNWFYEGEPTLLNLPASDWTTDELKANHVGDLYYDLLTGYSYRFILDGTYQWYLVPDADVAAALAAASAAQDTADSKRRVFTATPTTPYDVGDLWLTSLSASLGDIKKCITQKLTGAYDAAHWVIASKYTEGADWATNLSNIPGTLATPSGAGLYLSSTYLGYYSGAEWNSYIQNNGNFFFKGDANSSIDWNISTASTLTIKGKIVTGAGSSIDGQYLIAGSVGSSFANIALQGWTFGGTFSATDYNTVAWTLGTFTGSGGTSYSILAGNTGNMAALTYIYLDIAVSTTALQSSTSYTPANGKVLIAVASPNTDTASKASFQVFGGSGGQNIFVDNIAANTSSTNEFIANTANIANGIITNAKIVDLAVSKLTTGTIASQKITLGLSGVTDDCYIASGKTDFTNTDKGFILGVDNSDSDNAKLYVGDTTKYFNWDGTNMDVTSARFMELYTAGESITSGNVVCIKPEYMDISPSDDSYVSMYPSEDDENYGTIEYIELTDVAGGWTRLGLIKFDLSSAPSEEQILRAELILTQRGTTGGVETINFDRAIDDWNEESVTWNNMPRSSGDIQSVYMSTEEVSSVASNHQMTINITQLVRYWKAGAVTNYGLIFNAGGDGIKNYYSKENTTDASYKPILRIWKTQASSTPKIYKAVDSDYLLCRSIVGVSQDTVSADASCRVQVAGNITNITTSAGSKSYLSTSAGAVTNSTTNANRVISIGRGSSSNNLLWNLQDRDMLIENVVGDVSLVSGVNVYAPEDARYAKVYIKSWSNPTMYSEVIVSRELVCNNGIAFNLGDTGRVTTTWDTANNCLNLQASDAYRLNRLEFYT